MVRVTSGLGKAGDSMSHTTGCSNHATLVSLYQDRHSCSTKCTAPWVLKLQNIHCNRQSVSYHFHKSNHVFPQSYITVQQQQKVFFFFTNYNSTRYFAVTTKKYNTCAEMMCFFCWTLHRYQSISETAIFISREIKTLKQLHCKRFIFMHGHKLTKTTNKN